MIEYSHCELSVADFGRRLLVLWDGIKKNGKGAKDTGCCRDAGYCQSHELLLVRG